MSSRQPSGPRSAISQEERHEPTPMTAGAPFRDVGELEEVRHGSPQAAQAQESARRLPDVQALEDQRRTAGGQVPRGRLAAPRRPAPQVHRTGRHRRMTLVEVEAHLDLCKGSPLTHLRTTAEQDRRESGPQREVAAHGERGFAQFGSPFGFSPVESARSSVPTPPSRSGTAGDV